MAGLKELGKVQIGRSSKYPTKKSINLMYREHDTQDRIFTIVLFGIFMIFLYFFSRYGVAAQLARADAAEANYTRMEEELNKMKEANAQYADVRADYSHYGNGYLNSDELSRQDRVTMLNVIDERVHAAGGIQSIQIQNNIAVITVGVTDSQRIPDIILSLEGSEYVNYVTAQTAATDDDDYQLSAEGTPVAPLFVTAQLTIYFRTPQEVQDAVTSGQVAADDQALDAGESGNATGANAYIPTITNERPDIEKDQPETAASSAPSSSAASSTVASSNTSSANSGSKASAEQAAAQRAAQEAAQRQAAQAAQQQQQVSVPQTVAVQQQAANIDTPNTNPFTGGDITIQGGSPLG